MKSYCASAYRYLRRPTREVKVGKVGIGGSHPIRVQSMITSDTMDTAASVKQTLELVKVGCEIVRITACLLYTSPSPRDRTRSRMPSSA